MNASQIMTHEVIAVSTEDTVESVARLLITHSISALPVVAANNVLVGMVSLDDLFPRLKDMRFSGQRVAKLFDSLVNLADLPDFYWSTRHDRVADVMNKFVPPVYADDNLEQVTSLLLYSDYHSLPVIQDDKLIGIISRSDVLRAALRLPNEVTAHE